MSREKCPCELIVWYILPVIRKEFARMMVEEGNLSQKQAAEKLGLTEPAISQYLNSKRGSEMDFNPEITREIRKIAKELSDPKTGNGEVMAKICQLCAIIKDSDTLEKLDKKMDEKASAKCMMHRSCKAVGKTQDLSLRDKSSKGEKK